jgi:membrane protease subunit HflC
MNRKLLWISALVAFCVLIVGSITFTVDQSEYAVVTQFGRPVRTVLEPGLSFRWPVPIQRVYRFDRRLQLHEGALFETLTKDRKNIAIRFVVLWKLSDPGLFLESVGTAEAAALKLDDLLTSRGAGVLGDFLFDDLISVEHPTRLAKLEERVKSELSTRLKEGGYGMVIQSVEIDRLALPRANAVAVYERMRAERNGIASKFRAEGEEQADKIRAEADRQRSDILSKANEDAERIRGEGDAEAARIYADAFRREPDFYQFWRTLQSYEKILDTKTTLVLSEDSELLKYLAE